MPEQDAATIIISSPSKHVSRWQGEPAHRALDISDPKPSALDFSSRDAVVVHNSLKMSSSDNLTVSFGILEDQESFRLLEIPPALLASITSANPPSLLLKSAASDTGSGLNPQNHAVFCTDSQTFNVRQVQSSNSVFILQPSMNDLLPDDPSTPDANVAAIAQCTSTLELVPQAIMGLAALRQTLPIYNLADHQNQNGLAVHSKETEKFGRHKAFQNTPTSQREFDDAWLEVCAFELDRQAWIPSANSLKGIWASITAAAAMKDIDLTERFRVVDLMDIIEEDGFPNALFNAVIRRVSIANGSLISGWATVCSDKCVSWVGDVLLNAQSMSHQGISESDFLTDWKDLLPEGWRKHVSLSALKCEYFQPSKGRLAFGVNTKDGSAAISNPNGKRPGKWHEKFKNTRR